MTTISRRFTPEVEARNVDGSTELPPITGLAAVFYDPANPDLTQYQMARSVSGVVVERIPRDAFAEAMAADVDTMALQDHDPALFLGRRSSGTLEMSLTDRGLAYRIQTPPTKIGQDTIALIQRRDITGSSFSMFRARGDWSVEADATEKRYVRTVTGFEKIVDLGPVLQPAYPGTSAGLGSRSCGITQLSRSAGPPAEIAEIEAELNQFLRRNWYQAEAELRIRQLQILAEE